MGYRQIMVNAMHSGLSSKRSMAHVRLCGASRGRGRGLTGLVVGNAAPGAGLRLRLLG